MNKQLKVITRYKENDSMINCPADIDEELKEYIDNKKTVLDELRILRYCSREDIEELNMAANDYAADRICRRLIDEYYDKMLDDYENNADESYCTESEIAKSSLPTKTINTLLRHRFETFEDFETYCMENGWIKLNGIGIMTTAEIIQYMYPMMDPSDVTALAKQYKYKPKQKRYN